MTQPLKAGISETIILNDGAKGLHFINPQTEAILNGGTSESTKNSGDPVKDTIFLQDIAQSHHYTLQLEGFDMLKTPEGSFSTFLPVKSMNFNYTSYENMNIPVAIFGDFPILNKKRVSTVSITCYDLDDNRIERKLKLWENQCFPRGRYVAYMEDIVRQLTYRGYNVKGKETLYYTFYVMPSGNVTVSRDYSANDAKLVSFTLVCVGDGSTSATGEGSKSPYSSTTTYKVPMAGKDSRLSGDVQTTATGYSDLLDGVQGREFDPTIINGGQPIT